jgi:hypothetical protein
VLEIGAGTGLLADCCVRNGLEYAAIEANEAMAERLASRGFKVRKGRVPPLESDEVFEAIVMDQVFEHMRGRDEGVQLIEQCRSRLKDSGILLICSPDIFTAKHDFFQDYTHNYPTCVPMLTAILTDGDFEVVHAGYVSSFIRGTLITRLIAYTVRFLYAMGIFHVLFGSKAYVAKLTFLPSCVVVGRKRAKG